MPAYICVTCGVQHAPTDVPPERCPICDDERQYVGWEGQRWITVAEMAARGFRNEVRNQEPGLTGVRTEPRFAIGQRALLVQTPEGNVLWDCVSLIDEDTVRRVEELGGLSALSVSHPHFYDSMVEWSHAFGGAPIHLPRADREWVMRPDPVVEFYDDAIEVVPGVTLVRCGGHFEGSAVLHWKQGADGRGALLTGDSISVVQDRRYVTFMRSYPNYIPLPAESVRGILRALEPYPFDRLYGGWWDDVIPDGAQAAVQRSAERYIRYVEATAPPD
jgi:glyoxylase-like metal-dependent hydrolase (beta-lactamase superfamily II)